MHRNTTAPASFQSRWRSYRMQRARYMLPVGMTGGYPFGSSAGYLSYLPVRTCLPAPKGGREKGSRPLPMDACCVLCVSVYRRAPPASTVIPPRYWWCVALFIAASPLSRRRGTLHTNRSLVWRVRGTRALSPSLSFSSFFFFLPLSPAYVQREKERETLVYARKHSARAEERRGALHATREVCTYVSTASTSGFFMTPERQR